MSRSVLVAVLVFATTAWGQVGPPPVADLPPVMPSPVGAMATLTDPPAPAPVSYEPGDGLTLSMMNGQSKVKLFAQFSAIGQAATTRTFPSGGTLFLTPPSLVGNRTNTFDLHSRQTSIGASFTGPEVMGFTPGAFFLGFIQNDNLTSDAYGFLPFNAYGELKNDDWRFAAGLMSDLFNPVKPTMISLFNLFASGNTGSFRGQVRVERYLKPSDDLQLTGQFALGEPVASVLSNNRVLEDNGWPNIEARVAAGLGAVRDLAGGRKLRVIEVGVSGLVGEIRSSVVSLPAASNVPIRAVVRSWGLGADVQAAITERFGVQGEFFTGQGLGEYSGGIGQTFNGNTFGAIRATGGWGEAYYYLTDQFHIHTGYGLDAPNRNDLAATQIARNETYFTNVVWDVSKVLQVSFEVDYRKTEYIAFPNASGVVFVSQMLWRF